MDNLEKLFKKQGFYTINFFENHVKIINQLKLPHCEEYLELYNEFEVADAIKNMNIRGAPAIGIAAAFGMILAFLQAHKNNESIGQRINGAYEVLKNSRPTAVNLFWAIERMRNFYLKIKSFSLDKQKNLFISEALNILKEDIEVCKKIGEYGEKVIENNSTILTHCNAGSLATSMYGTALSVIRHAKEAGKNIKVFADETRPYLQGARLTVWELMKSGINVTLICDSAAGYFISNKKIDIIITGADRIALNGDTANKIGTYTLAVLAKENNIPFYIAAPISTIDFNIKSGTEIPIEFRDESEVLQVQNARIAQKDAKAANPSFDVTKAEYITGIITEKGLFTPPYNFEELK